QLPRMLVRSAVGPEGEAERQQWIAIGGGGGTDQCDFHGEIVTREGRAADSERPRSFSVDQRVDDIEGAPAARRLVRHRLGGGVNGFPPARPPADQPPRPAALLTAGTSSNAPARAPPGPPSLQSPPR